MVCSLVKKSVLGAALGAGTLFLVFGTHAPSYVKTAFHKVRQNVKESVDPQFEIDRARQDIENLKPMFDQNKETLARAEVEAENLEREVSTMQANLDQAKKTILAMQNKLKTGDFRLTGHIADTADNIKAELAKRLDHYDYTSDTLKQKQEVLRPSGKIIKAAHEQLSKPSISRNRCCLRSWPTSKPGYVSSRRRRPRTSSTSMTAARCPAPSRRSAELEKRLNVMAHRAAIDGRYGDLDSPSTLCRSPPRRDQGSRREVWRLDPAG